MKKIQELLQSGVITIDDIEEFLNYLGKESIDSEELERLEEIVLNHPG